jgi:hypothetical protein
MYSSQLDISPGWIRSHCSSSANIPQTHQEMYWRHAKSKRKRLFTYVQHRGAFNLILVWLILIRDTLSFGFLGHINVVDHEPERTVCDE